MPRRSARMGWFTDLCRNLGLMVHNIQHPDADEQTTRKVVKKEVEEEKQGKVTLRRTTIEEIEYEGDPSELKEEMDAQKRDSDEQE